jgi:hypothetical protein
MIINPAFGFLNLTPSAGSIGIPRRKKGGRGKKIFAEWDGVNALILRGRLNIGLPAMRNAWRLHKEAFRRLSPEC